MLFTVMSNQYSGIDYNDIVWYSWSGSTNEQHFTFKWCYLLEMELDHCYDKRYLFDIQLNGNKYGKFLFDKLTNIHFGIFL